MKVDGDNHVIILCTTRRRFGDEFFKMETVAI